MLTFTRELRTAIDVAASPARVWAVLTDFSSYPDWNPFIRSVSGVARIGQSLMVEIAPAGGSTMNFRPWLLVVDPERELRWRGQVAVPGLFDGEHVFRIEPADKGARFHQCEKFSGLLVPLMPSSIFDRTRAGFDDMNQAVKRRAESGA